MSTAEYDYLAHALASATGIEVPRKDAPPVTPKPLDAARANRWRGWLDAPAAESDRAVYEAALLDARADYECER